MPEMRRYPMTTEQIQVEVERYRKQEVKHPGGKEARDFTTGEWVERMQKQIVLARVAHGNNADPRNRLLYIMALIHECLETDGPL